MLKMNEILKRHRNGEQQGSAMIFALVLIIVVMALVTVVTALGLNNLQNTLFAGRYAYYSIAADAGINQALLVANSTNGSQALQDHQGVSNAVTGNLDPAYNGVQNIKWRWYTQRISNSLVTSAYYIIATGYSTSPTEQAARTIRVTLNSVTDMTATYSTSGGIIYYPGSDAVSQWGILGSSSLTLNTGVNIKSYISDEILNPTSSTGQAQVASNGNITVGTSGAADMLNLLNYSSFTPNRCLGGSCATYPQTKIAYATNLDQLAISVSNACPQQNYPVWIASANGGVLSPGCYNSLVFDTNTTIAPGYSSTNPDVVYIKGDVTVNPGVKVNDGTSPEALRIYSQGGTKAEFQQGTDPNYPTKFSGIVAGSVLTCTDDTTSSSVATGTPNLYIYGSLACDQVNLGGGTQVWWDELSSNIAGNTQNVRRLWYTVKYEELY